MEESGKMKPQAKAVLNPDNPLMIKFQAALKEHYTNHINRLKNEIFEYETEAKKNDEETERVGEQTHDAQQMLCKQHTSLDELISNVQKITATRQEAANKLEEKKTKYKTTCEKLLESEKTNLELEYEINSLNLLINQVTEWETNIESNITVSKRIAEKTRKDQLRLAEEKQKQDIQINKLMCAVWKLETENKTMNMQLRVKKTERESLDKTVASGNNALKMLRAEYVIYERYWNTVVMEIERRDRIIQSLIALEKKYQERSESVRSEIKQIKKLTKKKLNDNQSFALSRTKVESDIFNCKQKIDEEHLKRRELVRNIQEVQAIADDAEASIKNLIEVNEYKEKEKEILKEAAARSEERLDNCYQDFVESQENRNAGDKACGNLWSKFNLIREKSKDLEIIMVAADNKRSKSLCEIETEKYDNEERGRDLAGFEKMKSDLENEADAVEAEKVKNQMIFRKKERHVTVLNRKLEQILEKMKLRVVISPQELRLSVLEKQIEETQDEITNLQIFWLREEKNVLNISKERHEQIHKLDLLKKQKLILEQKNLNVSNEIENYSKIEQKNLQNINNLHTKMSVLCDHLNKTKDKRAIMDEAVTYLQSQFDVKLKDAELKYLQLEASIDEVEEEKIALSKELIELDRQALEWEKKIKLAHETKVEMRGTQGDSSDIDRTKQELQKKTVIHGQLKRTQQKMVKELEHCVSRRDAIATVAEARQTRSKASEERIRINNTRKIENIKKQIKQLELELKELKEKSVLVEAQKRFIQQEVEKIKHDINFNENYQTTLRDEIEKSKTRRQLKFEILIMMQRKLTMFNELAANRKPYMHTKKENLPTEYAHHRDMNFKLCNILQNLMTDFPNYFHELTRLYNTMKLDVYTQYSSDLDMRSHQ